MKYSVISTDNHINEPPETYVDRLPRHLRENAPKMVRGADGGDGWSFNGEPPRMTFGLSATGAITKQDYRQYKPSGIKWEELPPGNYVGTAAIKDNELDGVDAATIYPAYRGWGIQRSERPGTCCGVRARVQRRADRRFLLGRPGAPVVASVHAGQRRDPHLAGRGRTCNCQGGKRSLPAIARCGVSRPSVRSVTEF